MFERRHDASPCSEELGTLPSVYTASVQAVVSSAPASHTAERPTLRARPTPAARLAAVACFVAAPLLCTQPAAASDVPVAEVPLASAVEMSTLNPCFDRISLTDAIEDWLERSTVDARLRIHVSTDNGVPSFSIRLGDEPPLSRTFERSVGDCESERDAIALSIALAIDSLSSQTGPIRQPVWSIEAGGALTTAWSDRVNWGGALNVGARVGWHFEPQLGAVIVMSQDQSLGETSPARFDTRLILARGSGCFSTPLLESFTALGCVGGIVGPSRVSASGLADPHTETHLFAAVTGTLEFRLRFSRNIGLHFAADLLVPVRQGTLRVDDPDGNPFYVETLPPILGMFRVGPSAFF